MTKKKETSYNNQYKLFLATPQQAIPRVQYQHHSTMTVKPKTKPYHLDAQKLMSQVISNENIKHPYPRNHQEKSKLQPQSLRNYLLHLALATHPKLLPNLGIS